MIPSGELGEGDTEDKAGTAIKLPPAPLLPLLRLGRWVPTILAIAGVARSARQALNLCTASSNSTTDPPSCGTASEEGFACAMAQAERQRPMPSQHCETSCSALRTDSTTHKAASAGGACNEAWVPVEFFLTRRRASAKCEALWFEVDNPCTQLRTRIREKSERKRLCNLHSHSTKRCACASSCIDLEAYELFQSCSKSID
mmetsp:Transcript_136415/g.340139  ORF Transcript_136415/g.340139 Transcript_136415/m.340139 type:complete len:201 (-) Transcript_136415:16-618(-)